MAEQATQSLPAVVINPYKGIRQYMVSTRGKLDDGSEGTVHDPMRLMPGANRVPAERWKLFAKECKQDLDRGALRVMDKALKSYEERDAIEIVRNTIDKQLLNVFRANDTRKDVRKAIDKQLHDITGKAREDEELEA